MQPDSRTSTRGPLAALAGRLSLPEPGGTPTRPALDGGAPRAPTSGKATLLHSTAPSDRAYGGRPPTRDRFALAFLEPEPVSGYSDARLRPCSAPKSTIGCPPKLRLASSIPARVAPG